MIIMIDFILAVSVCMIAYINYRRTIKSIHENIREIKNKVKDIDDDLNDWEVMYHDKR